MPSTPRPCRRCAPRQAHARPAARRGAAVSARHGWHAVQSGISSALRRHRRQQVRLAPAHCARKRWMDLLAGNATAWQKPSSSCACSAADISGSRSTALSGLPPLPATGSPGAAAQRAMVASIEQVAVVLAFQPQLTFTSTALTNSSNSLEAARNAVELHRQARRTQSLPRSSVWSRLNNTLTSGMRPGSRRTAVSSAACRRCSAGVPAHRAAWPARRRRAARTAAMGPRSKRSGSRVHAMARPGRRCRRLAGQRRAMPMTTSACPARRESSAEKPASSVANRLAPRRAPSRLAGAPAVPHPAHGPRAPTRSCAALGRGRSVGRSSAGGVSRESATASRPRRAMGRHPPPGCSTSAIA